MGGPSQASAANVTACVAKAECDSRLGVPRPEPAPEPEGCGPTSEELVFGDGPAVSHALQVTPLVPELLAQDKERLSALMQRQRARADDVFGEAANGKVSSFGCQDVGDLTAGPAQAVAGKVSRTSGAAAAKTTQPGAPQPLHSQAAVKDCASGSAQRAAGDMGPGAGVEVRRATEPATSVMPMAEAVVLDVPRRSSLVEAGGWAVRTASRLWEDWTLATQTGCDDFGVSARSTGSSASASAPHKELEVKRSGGSDFGAEMSLRRWGASLAQLAIRSVAEQATTSQRASSPWAHWPPAAEEAAQAADAAAAKVLEDLPPLRAPRAAMETYTTNESFRRALESGDTALLRGSWLSRRAAEGVVLPCRQELQARHPRALWQADELMDHLSDGSVVVIAVSHCWLARAHPDPDGRQLRVLARALELLLGSTPLVDVALFIDWCSLHQRPRTHEEEQAFHRAMDSMHLWYAHQGTRVWTLSRVPKGAECAMPYGDRGWPLFERAVSEMVTPGGFLLDLGLLSASTQCDEDWTSVCRACAAGRAPPPTPQAFADALRSRHFSEGLVDCHWVGAAYANAFLQVFGGAEELIFNELQWGNVEALQLAAILPCCHRLRKLALYGNRIYEEGAAALVAVAPRCPSLEELWLTGNPVSKVRGCKDWLVQFWEQAGKTPEALKL